MKKMFIGNLLTPSIEREYCGDPKNQYVISATTFQRAFLSNIRDIEDVSIINAPDIGSWPKRSSWPLFKKKEELYQGVMCKHVPFLNITYIKRFSIYRSLYKEIDKWAGNTCEEKLIIVYSLLYPYIKAAVNIKKKYPNTKICCIVLDLPEYFGDTNSLIDRFVDKSKDIHKLVYMVDSFVLLTRQMSQALKINRKPWLLMEGIYNPVEIPRQMSISKTILYTGKLDARFGLRELVNSFMEISDKDVQLWICGNGLDSDYVKDASLKDYRIKYFGVIKQEEVFKMQQQASILVNPRRPEGEYTKYSFPSKTMEYLASGTPTIMYHLPGMPDEYLPFVELIDEKSPTGLRDALEKMLALTPDELNSFGARARAFILNNKTAKIQIARFKQFINENYENKQEE